MEIVESENAMLLAPIADAQPLQKKPWYLNLNTSKVREVAPEVKSPSPEVAKSALSNIVDILRNLTPELETLSSANILKFGNEFSNISSIIAFRLTEIMMNRQKIAPKMSESIEAKLIKIETDFIRNSTANKLEAEKVDLSKFNYLKVLSYCTGKSNSLKDTLNLRNDSQRILRQINSLHQIYNDLMDLRKDASLVDTKMSEYQFVLESKVTDIKALPDKHLFLNFQRKLVAFNDKMQDMESLSKGILSAALSIQDEIYALENLNKKIINVMTTQSMNSMK